MALTDHFIQDRHTDTDSDSERSTTSDTSSVSESCGKPPPPPYNPTAKILLANHKLQGQDFDPLEKNSSARITFSETVSHKSYSDPEFSTTEQEEDPSKSQSEQNEGTTNSKPTNNKVSKSPTLPKITQNINSISLNNSNSRSSSSTSTYTDLNSTNSSNNHLKINETELPVSQNTSYSTLASNHKLPSNSTLNSTVRSNSAHSNYSNSVASEKILDKSADQKSEKSDRSSKSDSRSERSRKSNNSRLSNHSTSTKKSFSRNSSSTSTSSTSTASTVKAADSKNTSHNMTYDQDFENDHERSVKFSEPEIKSPSATKVSRPGTAASMANSTSSVKSTRASRYREAALQEQLSRPSTAPKPKPPKAKPLWDPEEPPENPNKLPNYMRPTTSQNNRRKSRPREPVIYGSTTMKMHYEKINKDFPNIRSEYEMSANQKEQMEKRLQLRAKRMKEKENLERESKEADLQAAHDVWIAWYDTSIDEAKKQRREETLAKKQERIEKMEEEDKRKQEFKELGLDVRSWTKSKLLEKRQEEKRAMEEYHRMKMNTPSALEKIRLNDRAFRKWVRKVNKREKQEQEIEKIRMKMRNLELKKELRAKKALQSIRAAQEEAMTFKNFVF